MQSPHNAGPRDSPEGAQNVDEARIRQLEQELAHARARIAELEAQLSPRAAAAPRAERGLAFQRYFDNAPWGIFVADLTGRYVDVNPAGERMSGHPRGRLLDMGIGELAAEPRLGAAHFASALTGGYSTGVIPVLAADGGRRWWRVDAVRLPEDRVLAFALDLTAQVELERALQAEQRRHGLIVDSLPVLIAEIDRDSTYGFVNRRFEMLLGVPREDIIGRSIPEVLGQEAFAACRAGIEAAFAGRESEVELRLTLPGGEPRELHARHLPRAGEDGGVQRVYFWAEDITPRRMAERTYAALFEAMSSGVAVYRPVDAGRDFVFEDFNPAAERITRLQREDVLGRGLLEVFPGMKEFGLLDALAQALRTGTPLYLPTQPYRDAAREGWREISIYPLPSGRVVSIFNDVSARKRAELELVRAKEAAEAASRAKNEFLATMSHELRTPLNGVLGMLQLLGETGLDADQRECVDNALLSCRSLTRLIADILDLSRIEAGKVGIAREPFALAELTEPLESVFRAPAAEKGVALDIRVDPRTPVRLAGDAVRLRQVLFNLVGNAVKFTDQGRVEVLIAPAAPRDDEDVRLLLRVSDTGIGIPADLQAKVFEAFTQVDGSYTRKYQGAGLGLSIVKRLADLMGGSVALDSRPGEGSTFRVEVPLHLDQAPDTAPRAALPRPAVESPGARVLLAEDEAVNRLVIERYLTRAGHAVTSVADGREALEAMRAGDFDIVLMDIQMPEMDGLEAARRIRGEASLGARATVPIVALTSYAMAVDRARFLDAGMDDHLSKPVGLEEINEVVRRLARRGS